MPLTSQIPLPLYQGVQSVGNSLLLPIPWYGSERQEWCWAACAQMLVCYFQNALIPQCKFAHSVFPDSDCCDDSNQCDEPVDLEKVTTLLHLMGKSAEFIAHPLGFDDVKSEVAAGRPIQVGYQWSTQGNHVAVLAGISEDANGPLVYVNDPDPQFGHGWVYYDNLKIAYGHGSWQWTWTSIR